jgi:hypothetical protein
MEKKQKGKQVSVYTSIASGSGPRPVVKIKKHFHAVLKVRSRNPQDGIPIQSNIVSNLPDFITNDIEDQEEHSQLQQKTSRCGPQGNKMKR